MPEGDAADFAEVWEQQAQAVQGGQSESKSSGRVSAAEAPGFKRSEAQKDKLFKRYMKDIFESEGGALAADAAVQQSPEAFVPEFREIGHSILRCRDGRALRGRYSGRYFLLNSVPAFHGSCSRCG